MPFIAIEGGLLQCFALIISNIRIKTYFGTALSTRRNPLALWLYLKVNLKLQVLFQGPVQQYTYLKAHFLPHYFHTKQDNFSLFLPLWLQSISPQQDKLPVSSGVTKSPGWTDIGENVLVVELRRMQRCCHLYYTGGRIRGFPPTRVFSFNLLCADSAKRNAWLC